MRRKIAKRLKNKLRAMGCEIHDPHFIYEPGWKRKDCGYSAEILVNGWIICVSGKDELDCYRTALECATDILDEGLGASK